MKIKILHVERQTATSRQAPHGQVPMPANTAVLSLWTRSVSAVRSGNRQSSGEARSNYEFTRS